MSKTKKIKELESDVSEIFVVNDKDLRPYIELLNFIPENVSQKKMGRLLGFLEIKDESEDSAYIVNFISSVIKKEYFINPKRPITESFESSLNKANLALSEIAKHGNVEWLGKLDASICVIAEDEIHFSVSGNAKILLLRNNELIDISTGLAPDKENPYPMKTFVNVSSGKLEKDDKILVTTDDIFHIFSMNEIKKSAGHFSKEKFFQFLKTALVNELDIAGTFIIDVSENIRIETEEIKETNIPAEINAFSEKTFKENAYLRKPESLTEEKEISENHNTDKDKNKEYTDKKTGHIYLKDGYKADIEGSQIVKTLKFSFNEKKNDFLSWISEKPKKYIKSKFFGIIKHTGNFLYTLWSQTKNKVFSRKTSSDEEISNSGETQNTEKTKRTIAILTNKDASYRNSYFGRFLSFLTGIFSLRNIKFILPNYSKIKKLLFRMNLQQKIYVLLIFLAIVLLPLLILKNQNNTPYYPEEISTKEENEILPIGNTRAVEIGNIFEIGSFNDIRRIIFVNDQLFVISDSGISEIINENKREEYQLPVNPNDIKKITAMEDLELILIIDRSNNIHSFNAVSKKTQNNSIALPEDLKMGPVGTYLTYLYVTDIKNNQIYRYPRAEGGFGEKTNWIKEDIEMENLYDIAIDGNIYITNKSGFYSLFEGKKQDFNIEKTEPSINFEKVFTNDHLEYIYILDSPNNRVLKINKEGFIEKEYYHKDIGDSFDLAINESEDKAYLSSRDKIISFNLGQY